LVKTNFQLQRETLYQLEQPNHTCQQWTQMQIDSITILIKKLI